MTDVEVGTALLAAAQISAAATYILLGEFGADSAITPAARQSWHLAGAEFGVGADALVFAVGVFLASLAVTATGRAVPRWVGWTGLALGVAQMTPFGFLASPVFLLWVAVAGVALAIRAPAAAPAETHTSIPIPA